MNTELLEKVKAHILEEPRRLHMSNYVADLNYLDEEELPPCGTAACIAGWAVLLDAPAHGVNTSELTIRELDELVGASAENYLGITLRESFRLFYVSEWPETFRQAYIGARRDAPALAKIAAERIDHFIITNGAE